MTRPYSQDLRVRAVAAVAAGRSRHQVAKLFGVSVASVVRWCQRERATGSCAAKPMGGRRRLILLPERDWILARMSAAPDLTVRGLRRELVGRGVKVSYGAVWSFLTAEELTFKKNAARRRAGPAGRGAQARTLATAPRRG